MLFLPAYGAFESAMPNTVETGSLDGAADTSSHDDSVSAVLQLCSICNSLPITVWLWQLVFSYMCCLSKEVDFNDLECSAVRNTLASILAIR